MHKISASPIEIFASFWRNRALVHELTKREVSARYKGSALGILWSFFNPLCMLAVFTFVFSVIFQARWGEGSGSKTEFALVLFSGLLIFNLFSDCINRAPSSILSNINYVKKIVFPLEILPIVGLLSALFHTVISLAVWLIIYTLFFGIPHPTVLYFPVVILPFCFLLMGLSWALASLGVYLRDILQIISVITTVLMFMSPIFYPATSFPEAYRHLLYLNPLTAMIETTRNLLYWGTTPDFKLLGVYSIAAMVIASIGFAWFQKTRKGFADVL
jgi:lipopolysaccharide transport system permease protein